MSDGLTNLSSIEEFRSRKEGLKPERDIQQERISGARLLGGFTLDQASTLTGIPDADLMLMESGLLIPDVRQLQSLSLGLGFPVEWFYKPFEGGWPAIEHTSLRFHKERRNRKATTTNPAGSPAVHEGSEQ